MRGKLIYSRLNEQKTANTVHKNIPYPYEYTTVLGNCSWINIIVTEYIIIT